MTDRETHRWYGVAAVAFLAAGAGAVTNQPGLLLASVVGVAFAAYARSATAPAVELRVERELSEVEPREDEAVEVTVRVVNEGGALPDLRLIDGVPSALEVTEGSPRLGTALRAGRSATYRYTVEARRGVHAFDPVTVIARDASGARERETTVAAETTMTCVPRLAPTRLAVPLRAQTARFTGPVPTDVGGSGVEFFATREYRPGDSMARVDWNRVARTGELSTVEYRVERSATVVLVVDARHEAYVGGADHAVERSVAAARELASSLLAAGHQVGVGAIGAEDCWLAPSTGEAHAAAIERLLGTHPAIPPTAPDGALIVARRVRELQRRLPSSAQLFVLTPLADDYIATLIARLEANGNAATVVSPDPSADDTPGRRLARVERQGRIDRLRGAHVPVVDWAPGRPLAAAIRSLEARRR
ncbi:MAG: DUF58 domain-containing protein [Halobacteriales archaeon]|nr:DUF58 domain-containing protein [Halobacteriales archaeon]